MTEKGNRLEFGVLGPLEAVREGAALPLGGLRQRAVLALLLLDANRPVARERLIDGLWGERAPAAAANGVQVAVYGLRRLLGPDRVHTVGGGYELRVGPGELDLDRFRGLAQEAEAAARPPPRRRWARRSHCGAARLSATSAARPAARRRRGSSRSCDSARSSGGSTPTSRSAATPSSCRSSSA